MIILAPDFMTKVCKKAAQHFHCGVSKVFDRVKSVALWYADIRKLAMDHKGYGSAATCHQTFHPSTNAEKETRYIQYGPLLLFQ